MLTHRVGPPFCNFNPRLPRGRRRCGLPQRHPCGHISIHASLAGGDADGRDLHCTYSISIHASLAGGDAVDYRSAIRAAIFQSTPPSREATPMAVTYTALTAFQSTPPSREATNSPAKPKPLNTFQSTPPSREATRYSLMVSLALSISIHASLAGGDDQGCVGQAVAAYFNPRLPRGRRRSRTFGTAQDAAFQSTSPSREATRQQPKRIIVLDISIHVSLAGGDKGRF